VSVPAEVSLQKIKAELPLVLAYANSAGLVVDTTKLTSEDLRFFVAFKNSIGEESYVEFDCREYPMHPPTVEFVNKDRTERGLKQLYPQGFHKTPCICMRYNRKAYGERGGPHKDWRLLDWQLPTANGVAIDTLTLMISDLNSKIRASTGRMA
jgi:hypothetical protein